MGAFFNVTGILIFHPILYIRNIPLNASWWLGEVTRVWRDFPFAYITVILFVIPLLMLAIPKYFVTQPFECSVLSFFFKFLLNLNFFNG